MRRGKDMGMDPASPIAAHRATPAELKAQLEAARSGDPFLIYRDGSDVQRITPSDRRRAERPG